MLQGSVGFLNIKGRHAVEHGEERLLVQFLQLVGCRVAEQHLGRGDRVGIFISPVDHCGKLLGEKLLERPAARILTVLLDGGVDGLLVKKR